MKTNAGFVAIIGKPNAGKSTLLNSILKTKLSITTRKAQTTRKRVTGILTENNTQIVFLDTPGIIKAKYELQKKMMEYVEESLEDADIVMLIIDASAFESVADFFDEDFLSILKKVDKPKIAVFNKIDRLKNIQTLLPHIAALSELNIFDEIIPISAKKKAEISTVVKELSKYLPEHEFYYDAEYLSTQNERFFVSELIREQVFKFYSEELPYSTDVHITEFKERERGKWFIAADIIVERSSQKMIIIGEKGSKIKELGSRSRRQIESYLEMPVFLELFVKIREKWRNDKNRLKSLGY